MMEKTTLRKYKWFWPWQDEVEEAWLRDMSQQGCHLSDVRLPIVYIFESGEPKDFVYRLDYPSFSKLDKEDYLQLFMDTDWEFIEERSGWYYFRQPAQSNQELEIYTDAESKISKYQRLQIFAALILLPLIISIKYTRGEFLFFIIFPLFLIWVYIFIRIWIRINHLKRI
jgi:hypothetical protein